MTRACAAVALAVCVSGLTAEAQERTPAATFAPANIGRWDAAGHVVWLGEHRPDQSTFEWDRWLGVAAGGGSLGYYWTPHLKTEVDISASNEDERYSYQLIPVPGSTTPLYVERDHAVRFTTASLGVTGQFFENAWFHPFVGTGLELVRDREHVEVIPPPVPPRGVPVPALAVTDETHVRYRGRPFTAMGFKAYLSPRAFIRTDIRMSWSRDGLAALAWRSGVGFDF